MASSIRLPEKITPYKIGVIGPMDSSMCCDEMHLFTECLLEQLDSIPQLANEVLFDDRIYKSYGSRLQFASSLGFHIIFLKFTLILII